MTKTVLEFVNGIPTGEHVVIHFPTGSTEWDAGTPEVNRLLLGRIGRHIVDHSVMTYTASNSKIHHIYPRNSYQYY